ncbi:MAG: hypothetical protein GVY06_11970 [Alphaproteobacteria bacterium]|jgi:hypothetical protein|nr:hypothetical protein [Alphaproteobacteria bacterium]
MLFLLDSRVVEVEMPEIRLARRWRILGCGDPHGLRARDAIDFARAVMDESRADGGEIEPEIACDIAALIISKTGANAAQFVPCENGTSEARLDTLPEDVLSAFQSARSATDGRDSGASAA